MSIGIIVATLALLFGVQTTADIVTKDNQLVPGYEIDAHELEELRESMEPELFDGVIYYYETEESVTEPESIDTSVSPIKVLYAQKGLNARNKPGIHGKVVGVLTTGEQVNVYQEKDGWSYIKTEKFEGYTSTKFLVENKPEPPKPKPAPAVKKKPVASASADQPKRVSPSVVEDGTYETEMTFNLSFYTNLPQHNGGYSKTASGKLPGYGMVANNKLPFGTKIYLEGWGVFTVEDRGGSHFNSINRLDIFIPPKAGESEKEYIARLRKLGRQSVRGTILN